MERQRKQCSVGRIRPRATRCPMSVEEREKIARDTAMDEIRQELSMLRRLGVIPDERVQ